MKQSRTALALFLAVFAGLLSAVELTGPVSIASEGKPSPKSASACPYLPGCDTLWSLGYCEYAYDAAPKAAASKLPRYWDIEEEDCAFDCEAYGLDVYDRGQSRERASTRPEMFWAPECPDEIDSIEPIVVPVRSAAKPAPKAADQAYLCVAGGALPPAQMWMNGSGYSIASQAWANSLGPDACDLSFLPPTVAPSPWMVARGRSPIVIGLEAAASMAKNFAVAYTEATIATSERVLSATKNTYVAAKARSVQRRGRTTQRAPAAQRSR